MRYLKTYETYNSDTVNAEFIIKYIRDITPEESDIPDYFLSMIKKSGDDFYLTKMKVSDLMDMDKYLKEFILSDERGRYDDENNHIPEKNDYHLPIVLFITDEENIVMDGFNRTKKHYYNGDEYIDVYVNRTAD